MPFNIELPFFKNLVVSDSPYQSYSRHAKQPHKRKFQNHLAHISRKPNEFIRSINVFSRLDDFREQTSLKKSGSSGGGEHVVYSADVAKQGWQRRWAFDCKRLKPWIHALSSQHPHDATCDSPASADQRRLGISGSGHGQLRRSVKNLKKLLQQHRKSLQRNLRSTRHKVMATLQTRNGFKSFKLNKLFITNI